MKVWTSLAKFHVKAQQSKLRVEAVKVGFKHITVAMGAVISIPLTLSDLSSSSCSV